jgi:DNA-3-methyladenine glycosylase II
MELIEQNLRTEAALRAQLDALVALDESLLPVVERVGEVPLRATAPGFEGLSRIIVGQLLSVQSAAAIWTRFEQLLGEVTAERFIELAKSDFADVGLSEAKYATIRAIANAEIGKTLRYDLIAEAPLFDAMKTLTAIKGVGPWTAEVYLSFCVGHRDIFPAGDLALRKIIGHHLNLDATPSINDTMKLTLKWSPYRGAAARLMWRYYAVEKQKEGIGI